MDKKRITYLDTAKGVAILIVVACHTIGYLEGFDAKEHSMTVYQVISSFVLPLFYIISGMLVYLTKETEKDYREVVKKKARGIMLPYLSFSMVYLAIDLYFYVTDRTVVDTPYLIECILRFITLDGIGVLWFLPALFFGEMLFVWIKRRCSDRVTIGIFSVTGIWIIMISPIFRWEIFHSNMAYFVAGLFFIMAVRAVFVSSFLMIGFYLKKWLIREPEEWKAEKGYTDRQLQVSKWKEIALAVVLAVITVAVSLQNNVVDLHFLKFFNGFFYAIETLAGSLSIILFCKNIQIPLVTKIFTYFGVNSLVVMGIHQEFKVIIMSIQFSYWLNTFITRAKDIVLFVTMAMAALVLLFIWVEIINRFFYWFIGKGKPKEGLLERLRGIREKGR